MNDPMPHPAETSFEREVLAFVPAAPSASLRAGVAAGIEFRQRIARNARPPFDRILASFLTCGGVAAALIVAFHTLDYLDVRRHPPIAPAPAIVQNTTAHYLAALAAGKDPLRESAIPQLAEKEYRP